MTPRPAPSDASCLHQLAGVPTARSSRASRPDPPTSGRTGALSASSRPTSDRDRRDRSTPQPRSSPAERDRLPPGRRCRPRPHAGSRGTPASMSGSPRVETGERILDFAGRDRSAPSGARLRPARIVAEGGRQAAGHPAHRAPRVRDGDLVLQDRRRASATTPTRAACTRPPARAARRRLARPTRPGLRRRPLRHRSRLIDWCACGNGHIIDLYSDAFRRLAPLSSGGAAGDRQLVTSGTSTTCSARNQTWSSWRRSTSLIRMSLVPQSSDSSVVLIAGPDLLDDRLVGAQRPVDHDRDLLGAIGRPLDRRQLGGVTRVADGDAAEALDPLGEEVDDLVLLLGVLVEQQVELVEGRARRRASDASCTARRAPSSRPGSR